ncbi:unnamed protein product [Scytosiphon promiscuus]
MPSRNAASFSLLVSGGAGARGQSRHQRARQYMALNDTRPPEGQVIGMCLGHSVLGYDWHQQEVRPPAVKQPSAASRVISQDGGGSSHGHQRMLTSSTPPRPSRRAPVPAVDSAHSPSTVFRRERGGSGGGGRAGAMQDERNNHSDEQEGDGMGEFARPDRGARRDIAPRGGGRGRGRQDSTGSPAAASTTNSDATGLGRRRARAEAPASTASAAAADVAMDGAACSTVTGREFGGAGSEPADSTEWESLPRYGSGASGFRTAGTWSGKTMDSTAGRERREGRGSHIGEGGKRDEGAAEAAPVVATTRGRVGMKKARRTYGR